MEQSVEVRKGVAPLLLAIEQKGYQKGLLRDIKESDRRDVYEYLLDREDKTQPVCSGRFFQKSGVFVSIVVAGLGAIFASVPAGSYELQGVGLLGASPVVLCGFFGFGKLVDACRNTQRSRYTQVLNDLRELQKREHR
jgi:hypothetical protein